MCVLIHVTIGLWRSEADTEYISQLLSTFFSETRSLTEPEASKFGYGWPERPWDPSTSTFSGLGCSPDFTWALGI